MNGSISRGHLPAILLGVGLVMVAVLSGCHSAWRASAAGPTAVTGPDTPVTRLGKPLQLQGATLRVGDEAPDVTLIDIGRRKVKISSFRGKVVLLSVVSIIDSPVCTDTTRHFDTKARAFGKGAAVVVVSSDTPYAQAAWVKANDVNNAILLSDPPQRGDFGRAYGLRIKGLTILARTVLVIDRKGLIRYIQVVGENTNTPDLAAPVKMVEQLLAQK